MPLKNIEVFLTIFNVIFLQIWEKTGEAYLNEYVYSWAYTAVTVLF